MEGAPITYKQCDDYLLVIGHGKRDNFNEIINATVQINDVLLKFQRKHLLIDYREVHFNIPIGNVFDVVRIYESKMPHLKDIFVAVVLSEINWDIGKFWKEIAQRRGFNFNVFNNFNAAEQWLQEQQADQANLN
jgi:hypothetical protein